MRADISWIKSELMKIRDPEIVQAFKNLLLKRQQLAANEDAELNASFERALEEMKSGLTTPHNEVRKKYEKWL